MIFMAQLPQLIDVPWLVYPMVPAGLVMIFLLPKLTKAVPAPLVSIVVLTVLTVAAGFTVPNVGGEGELPDSLPFFGLPGIPLTWETLTIIATYALGVALVGLMESLMTAKLVDDNQTATAAVAVRPSAPCPAIRTPTNPAVRPTTSETKASATSTAPKRPPMAAMVARVP